MGGGGEGWNGRTRNRFGGGLLFVFSYAAGIEVQGEQY